MFTDHRRRGRRRLFLILAVFGKSYAAGVLVHKNTNLADSMVNTIQEVPAPPMRFRQDYAD
jgi:hypothetical protein